jgi:UDP-N-acetylmuramoylalanine--D-glutamate ligase
LVGREQGRVKGAVFIGEAKGLLAEAFDGAVPYVTAGHMKEAVATAFSMAEPGDVVLLAPACSSFDMFSDYRHRGDMFKAAVKGLVHG